MANHTPYHCALLTIVSMVMACGSPFDLTNTEECRTGIYRQRDSVRLCADILPFVNQASRDVTDIVASGGRILVLHDTSPLDRDHAWGKTYSNGDVLVNENTLPTLVHEAFHVRDGPGHCGWSAPAYISILERDSVAGVFYDECKHVTCGNQYEYTHPDGRIVGWGIVCK